MRVLFIKLSDTTDIINTLPAITAFKRDRPDAWVVYATFQGVNADIVESCQAIGEVLIVPERLGDLDEADDEDNGDSDKKNLLSTIRKTAQKTLAGTKVAVEFVKQVQALNLDVAVDLHVSMRSAVIARNSGASLVYAFRSENAANKKAALAFANTPYVNPSQPDYEKYNLLIANSLGTSASSQFDWSMPRHDPSTPSMAELQIIPTGMIDPKYWCGVLQLMIQQRIPFRLLDCPLTKKETLSRIMSDLFGMDLQITAVDRDLTNALVQHGGPIIADGAAAYLGLALGHNTLAVGEKPTSPFIAQVNTYFYSYPGPKDLPYCEQFVELAVELLNHVPETGPQYISSESYRLESDETVSPHNEEHRHELDLPEQAQAGQPPASGDNGLDDVSRHDVQKEERHSPLMFNNPDESKE